MATTWETLEEREQRVRGTRTSRTMARAAEQVPESKSLKAAFADRRFISREDLRNLVRQNYERPVITLYLNFSPGRLVRADPPVFVTVFHSLRHQALEARKPYIEALPHAQRLGVPDDLHEIQAFLEGYVPEGERAIVIYKSGAQLNRVMPLPLRGRRLHDDRRRPVPRAARGHPRGAASSPRGRPLEREHDLFGLRARF